VSEKSRFRVESFFEHFAVYDGEDFLFICESRHDAEREKKLWQARVEVSERVDRQDAEIQRLKGRKKKAARDYAREMGEASAESRRDAAELRIDLAKALIIEAAKVKPALTRSGIFERVSNKEKWEPEGLKPYGRSTIYELIAELREHRKISPPPFRK
jgi:hypothetical protein